MSFLGFLFCFGFFLLQNHWTQSWETEANGSLWAGTLHPKSHLLMTVICHLCCCCLWFEKLLLLITRSLPLSHLSSQACHSHILCFAQPQIFLCLKMTNSVSLNRTCLPACLHGGGVDLYLHCSDFSQLAYSSCWNAHCRHVSQSWASAGKTSWNSLRSSFRKIRSARCVEREGDWRHCNINNDKRPVSDLKSL